MNLECSAKQSLLIVNNRAGNGNASRLASEITNKHHIPKMDICSFFSLNSQQLIELLLNLRDVFVLGGDGSVFSILNLLSSLKLENEITVFPIGLGGENVLAKHSGSFGRSIRTVEKVLQGQYTTQLLQPFTVELQNADDSSKVCKPYWSVHAAFSAKVLHEIEARRESKATDFQRRYGSVLKTLAQLRTAEQVLVSGVGIESRQVLDFGVISAALPYWTSKFKIPVVPEQTAILHTIEGQDRLLTEPYSFAARLSLELICLLLGITIPREIIRQQTLGPDFSVKVATKSGIMAVDSELFSAQSATVTNLSAKEVTENNSSKVLLGRL